MSAITAVGTQQRCVRCGAFVRQGMLCPLHREEAQRLVLTLGDIATHERIPLADLTVDERFQRKIDEERVQRYKLRFNKRLLGDLLISRREDGEQVILDGQHRWLLLLELGYDKAPCEVLSGLTYQEEALIFAERNAQRVTPNKAVLFNANAEAGMPEYRKAREMVGAFGYRVGGPGKSEPKTLKCIGTVEQLYASHLLAPVLSLIRDVWPGQHAAVRGELLMGVATVLKAHPELDVAELAHSWRSNAGSTEEIFQRARGMRLAGLGRDLWRHIYSILVAAYNYKRSRHAVVKREIRAENFNRWIVRTI